MTVGGAAMPSPDDQHQVVSPQSFPAATVPQSFPAATVPQSFPAATVPQSFPAATVPQPPPGPGVQPPFVAPPTDGVKKRRWWAAGLISAAVLLCCAGGVVGVAGLIAFGSQMAIDQGRAVVTDYLTAIRDDDFELAYQLLCDSAQQDMGLAEFERRFTSPNLSSFVVGDPTLADTVEVPATLQFTNGTSTTITYLLEQDSATGEFEVCGQEG